MTLGKYLRAEQLREIADRDGVYQRELAELAADLRRFGRHRSDCAAWDGQHRPRGEPQLPERCDCGLVAALTRANAR